MSAKRTAMRKLREALRLRYRTDLSIRQISASIKISIGSIQNILKHADHHQLAWLLPEELDGQISLTFVPSGGRVFL